jgi:hypothetical protein
MNEVRDGRRVHGIAHGVAQDPTLAPPVGLSIVQVQCDDEPTGSDDLAWLHDYEKEDAGWCTKQFELVHAADACASTDDANRRWLTRLRAAPDSDALRHEYAGWLEKRRDLQKAAVVQLECLRTAEAEPRLRDLLKSVPRSWSLAILSRRIPVGERYYPRASPSQASKVIAEYATKLEEHLIERQESANALALEKASLPRLAEQARESGAGCPHCKSVPREWRVLLGSAIVCGHCKRSSRLNELVPRVE